MQFSVCARIIYPHPEWNLPAATPVHQVVESIGSRLFHARSPPSAEYHYVLTYFLYHPPNRRMVVYALLNVYPSTFEQRIPLLSHSL